MGKDWKSDLVAATQPCELVLALGHGWGSCEDALPWDDRWSSLLYVVYSPSYCGDLFLCRFQLVGAVRWWHEGMAIGISGVTHWRVALRHETSVGFLKGALPGSTVVDGEALEPLRRWWAWFRDYKGIEQD